MKKNYTGCIITFCLINFLFFPLWIFLLQVYQQHFYWQPYLLWLIPYTFLVMVAYLFKRLNKPNDENKK
jgi:lipopolysaccharide export LptBFGC system permease protein LptF